MKSEAGLSDKEWRQMRRLMPKLDFEPVPETPALLPRSLYGESDTDLASRCEEQEEKPEEIRESAFFVGDVSSNHHSAAHSHKNRSATTSTYGQWQKQSEKTVNNSSELPSTSMAVSPLVTSRYRPREQKRPPETKCELDDAEIAALDAQMAAAQETIRRSVMSAFIDLKAKKARSEALERMKVSAAHTSDVKILQNKVEELKEQVARAETQREQSDLRLDRFSGFTAKQSRLNEIRWSGEHSVIACFHAWYGIAQQTVAKRSALCRVLTQSDKRQQLASFRHWKETAQGVLIQNQLQDQRDRYEHRIIEIAKEYQLKVNQLQQELEDAKNQVAESQKCRQKLEEDLRLIFLRGVSAMNIEALTVFGSSHKHDRQLRDKEQPISQSHQQESNGGRIAESVKRIPSSSIVPEAMPLSKKPAQNTSSEANAPAPVAIEASGTVCSAPNHSRVSIAHQQVPPYLDRAANGWSPVSKTSGLRSAEMIRQHELSLPVGRHSACQSASSSFRPSSAPSPTNKRSSSQMNSKYQVEVQYMRSTVAASAARASGSTCARPVPATRSPLSSARSRRS